MKRDFLNPAELAKWVGEEQLILTDWLTSLSRWTRWEL